MKILLTNDDGYNDKGIWALAEEMATIGDVVIVAPERQRSAASHSITLHKPIRLKRVAELEKRNIQVFYTNGTPADCAMLAILEVMPDADILISGINLGSNLGEDILYSGTVSAALEGALLGKLAISVSIVSDKNIDYSKSAKFVKDILLVIVSKGLPKKTILNINFPADGWKDYRITHLGSREYCDVIEKRIDPRGEPYYWIGGKPVRDATIDNSDYSAIAENMVSITPVCLDMTNQEFINILKTWKFNA